jgi:hypothetical protein
MQKTEIGPSQEEQKQQEPRAYLEPNSDSMHRPIEGRVVLARNQAKKWALFIREGGAPQSKRIPKI